MTLGVDGFRDFGFLGADFGLGDLGVCGEAAAAALGVGAVAIGVAAEAGGVGAPLCFLFFDGGGGGFKGMGGRGGIELLDWVGRLGAGECCKLGGSCPDGTTRPTGPG